MSAAAGVGLLHVELVMGTAASLDVRDANATPSAIGDVIRWLHHVDETFSPYKAESPISALGRGEIGFADVTEEIRDVLRRCEELRVETNGAFDAFSVPAPNGTMLDPSGYVKGWSIERSAEILEANGCRNFCINAGGDIAVRGEPESGEPWRIGMRHPDDRDAVATVVNGRGRLAVATSALYERGAHIVDPRCAQPCIDLASVTIVGADLALADGYATAVFVMGLDGLEWIADRAGYDAYLITRDGVAAWTDGFARYRAGGDTTA